MEGTAQNRKCKELKKTEGVIFKLFVLYKYIKFILLYKKIPSEDIEMSKK